MATQVTLDSAKFERLFTSIERQMIMQSSFLESIYNIQTYQLDLDREREETRRRELDLLRMGMGPTQEPPAPRPDTEETTQAAAKDGFEFPNISTMGLLGGGLAIALAGPITDFLSGAIGRALENAGMSPDFASNMANALGQAGAWATVGSVFGKKAAMWFGVAGLSSSIFTNEITDLFDTNQDGIADAFGAEISPELATGIGTAMGIGAAGVLNYGPIQSKMLMGVSMLMTAYGDDAAKFLEEKAGVPADFSEGAIDALSGAAYGAALGGMFGPTGMLVGAIAGFAIAGGASLLGWLNEKSAADLTAAKDRAEKDLKNIEQQLAAGRTELAAGSIKSASESIANLNLYDSDAAAALNQQLQDLQKQYTAAGGQDESVAEAVTTASRFVEVEQAIRNPDAAREDPKALADAKAQIDDYINYQYQNVDPTYQPFDVSLADVKQAIPLSPSTLSADYINEAQRYMESELKKKYGIVELSADQIKAGYIEYANSRNAQMQSSKISEAPMAMGTGGAPTLISSSNNGNVTRGGDTNVSHTTNIYGVTPAKALNEGNSVPRPYYANQ
jgi:hypothetical protein